VESDGALVSSVKLADDGSGDLVVRLWESRGGRTTARLILEHPVSSIVDCDALEDPTTEPPIDVSGTTVDLILRPFQIRTLRLRVLRHR
jgi:alpha-mannosidase